MDVSLVHAKKILGYVLIVLCIPLLISSIMGYLFTAHPFIGSIEKEFVDDVSLAQGKFFHIWYNLSHAHASIIVNLTLRISFEVRYDEVIDFYVMSDSQYEQWGNGSTAIGILEKRGTSGENLVFIPTTEGRYYLVLDNTQYNVSKLIHFQSTWTAAVHLVEYSEAFNWLTISVISLVLLTIGSVLSANPIAVALRNLLDLSSLRDVKNIRGLEYIKIRDKQHLKFFWVTLGLLTMAVSITIGTTTVRNLPYAQEDFPEVFPLFLDIHIRLFLYCFVWVVFFSLLGFVWGRLFDFLDDLDLWYFVKIKKLRWNPDLRVHSFYIFRRMLISIESVGYYIVGLIMFATGYFLMEFRFAFFVAGTFVLSVPVSRSIFRSFREACKDLKLRWRNELKSAMPFALNEVVIAIWVIPLFLLALRILFPAVLDIAEFFTINSLPQQRFQEYFYSKLDPTINLIDGIEVLTSNVVVFTSLFFALILVITYYFMPLISRKVTRKRKLKSLIAPIVAASLSFAMNEIYMEWVSAAYVGGEEWSLFISFIAFGATYLIGRAYEEAMK